MTRPPSNAVARGLATRKANQAAAWLREAEAAVSEFASWFDADVARWHQDKDAAFIAALRERRIRHYTLDLAGAQRAAEVTQATVTRLQLKQTALRAGMPP